MGRLRDWWDRVTGRTPAAAESQPGPAPKADAREVPQPTGGLSLADGPPQRTTSKTGRAGFDPYASDAGFAKPHSWERVDHD